MISLRNRAAIKTILTTLAIILAIVAVLEFLLYRSLNKFTKIPPEKHETTPAALLFNANEVGFRAADGADLHGWLIQGNPGGPVLIIAHDYGSSRSAVLQKLESLIFSLSKQGYYIFLFDFRGHGGSTSASAFGYKEDLDLHAAISEVLKYKKIEPRIGVLGIGMGAIAAIRTCGSVESVKFLMLDSVYDDIPYKLSKEITQAYPFVNFAAPALMEATSWNMRPITGAQSSKLNLEELLPKLYPKPVLFVEKNPLSPSARRLYDAAKEPKELIQLGETASGELLGGVRDRYKNEIETKILQYFPPSLEQTTIEILK
ncbi:MAG TPA: alpha/beta fold hydrolase [Acidobacteriota bacterium]|nr:alpha/beta fold hydrolase [Acidobacteriota bacterium]